MRAQKNNSLKNRIHIFSDGKYILVGTNRYDRTDDYTTEYLVHYIQQRKEVNHISEQLGRHRKMSVKNQWLWTTPTTKSYK